MFGLIRNEYDDQINLQQTENNLKLFETKFKKFQENSTANYCEEDNDKFERLQYDYNRPLKKETTDETCLQKNYKYNNANQSLNDSNLRNYQKHVDFQVNTEKENFQKKYDNNNMEMENMLLKEKINELSSIIRSYSIEKNIDLQVKEINSLKNQIFNLNEERNSREKYISVWIL